MNKQISRIKFLWLMLVTTLMVGLSISSALAQKFYPVHAHVQLLRPYGLHLTDYYSGSRDKFIITLNNRDNEQPFLQARLRIRIKNHGFLLSSREEVVYPMLELNSGIPLRLTSTDITPYLLPQNLNINGRFDNGRLPTGMTEFSVQVVDYYNQQPLSAWHTARAWLDIKKPPMLKLPSKDEQIAFREPTNIRFQWLPRHQGLAQTEYEFVLKELPNNGAAPQSAFAYGIEIFRTRTRFTRLMYNQLMPVLEPNRRYAWQVQAIALDGIDEIGLFENNGFSEIGWFNLSEECPAPTGLKAVPKYARAELSWSPVPQATAYAVAYRPKSSRELFEWTEQQVFDTQTTAYSLKRGWTYEWRVGSLGQSNKPVYSDLDEFTVLEEDTELLENCGKVPDKSIISQEPKLDLVVGDIVTIGGDYPMRVTELQNLGDGWYSGKGKTELTTMVRVQVALQFNRLRVNTDNRQCDGRVEAIYDKGKGHIENADLWDDGGETLKTGSLNIVEHKLDFKLPPMPKMTLNEETGEIETEGADGKIHVIKLDVPQNGIKSVFPIHITDKDGNTYKVNPDDASDGITDGNKEKGSKKRTLKVSKLERVTKFDTEGLDKSLGAYVVFSRGEGKYAFDEGKEAWYQGSAKMVDYYQPFAEDYIAPWKLVPVGKQDIVIAQLNKDIAINQRAVKFATKEGLTLASQYDAESQSWTIELESTENNRSYDVFALYEGKTIGKLRVVSYLEKSQSITLVPINNAKIDVQQIEQELKAIYEPIGIHLTVKLDESLRGNYAWDLDGDKQLNFAGTSFWGKAKDLKISKEMKELQKIYKASVSYKKDEAYLFVLNEAKSLDKAIDIQGDMPRKSQFGYIFASNIPNARVIAHEIGHGVFTLQHTFDDEYGNTGSKGKTNNLMDYAEGSHLAAFQWNIAFNKAWLTALDKGKDGEYHVVTPQVLLDLLTWIRNNKNVPNANYNRNHYFYQYRLFETRIPLNVENRKEPINVYVELGDSGIIDFSIKDNKPISLAFELSLDNKFHNTFSVKIFYKNKRNSNPAITIWTKEYDDIRIIINYIGYRLSDEYVISEYKKVINKRKGDCNRLDVIYETIPDFVAKALDDDILFRDLQALSECSMAFALPARIHGRTFQTDEEKAVINILKGIKDRERLYLFLKDNSKLTIKLIEKIDSEKNKRELNNIFLKLGTTYWAKREGLVNELYGRDKIFFLTKSTRCGARIKENYFFFWNLLVSKKAFLLTQFTSLNEGYFNPMDPVFLIFTDNPNLQDDKFYSLVPAVYLYYLAKEIETKSLKETIDWFLTTVSIYGSAYTLIKSTGKLARGIAWAGLLNDATRLFFENSELKSYIETQAWGEDFLKSYYIISTTIDLVNISNAYLYSVEKNAGRVRSVIREHSSIKELNLFEKNIQRASKELKRREHSKYIVGKSSNIIKHTTASDFQSLKKIMPTARAGGKRAINNVKKLVDEGKALVIKPIEDSPLAHKVDDYLNAFKSKNYKLQGDLGEEISEMLAKELDNGTVLNLKINNSGHGFDVMQFEGSVQNPKIIRIIESKPLNRNSIILSGTKNEAQMSFKWMKSNIQIMRNMPDDKIRDIGKVLDKNYDLIERYVMTIDKNKKLVIFIKLDKF